MDRRRSQYNQRIGEEPYQNSSGQSGYGYGYGYDYGNDAGEISTKASGGTGASNRYQYDYTNTYNTNYGDAYNNAYGNTYNNAYNDAYSNYGTANNAYADDPYRRAAEESRTEYDDDYYESYDQEEEEYNGPVFSASRGIVFKPVKQKKHNILLAIIMTAVMGICGFVAGKIINTRKPAPQEGTKPTVVQTSEKRPVVVEEEEVPIPQILSVVLNTTDPVFGTSRLKIDYEVDADAMVRIEILNGDDTVFTTIESATEVSEGKMRTYFDGYNENGDWITLGTYKVRVSALKADPSGAQPTETEDGRMDYTDVVWVIDNFMTADFVVTREPYRTPNSRPAAIPQTPTPSEEPSEEPTPTPSEEPTEEPTETEPTEPTETEPTEPTETEPTEPTPGDEGGEGEGA